MKTLLLPFLLLIGYESQDQTEIIGTWKIEENNVEVDIIQVDDVVSGTVVKSDVEKAIGKVILRDFIKNGDKWDGKFYAVKRDRLVDATLKATGGGKMEMVISAGPRSKTVPLIRIK